MCRLTSLELKHSYNFCAITKKKRAVMYTAGLRSTLQATALGKAREISSSVTVKYSCKAQAGKLGKSHRGTRKLSLPVLLQVRHRQDLAVNSRGKGRSQNPVRGCVPVFRVDVMNFTILGSGLDVFVHCLRANLLARHSFKCKALRRRAMISLHCPNHGFAQVGAYILCRVFVCAKFPQKDPTFVDLNLHGVANIFQIAERARPDSVAARGRNGIFIFLLKLHSKEQARTQAP